MQEISKMKDVTLFAPSNLAWSTANTENIYNREKLREILNLHLVREQLNVERILNGNINQVCLPLIMDCMIFVPHLCGFYPLCKSFLCYQ